MKKHPLCLIRVVDDDAGVRDSYRYLIESEGWMVRTYQDAEDFLVNDDAEIPGCAIVDIRMPGLSGLELQAYLKRIAHPIPIIFVSAHGDIEMAVRAIQNGAMNFLPKPINDDQLLDSIERAVEVGLKAGRKERLRQQACTRWALLSAREQEVAKLVAEGLMNKVIAADLGISERTVQTHRERAYLKMQVRNAVGMHRALSLLRDDDDMDPNERMRTADVDEPENA